VTFTMIAESSGSSRLKFVTMKSASRPCPPVAASRTSSAIAVLPKNEFFSAVKPASAVSQTISNSIEASFSVPTVAFQPLLARVVTSASPFSRFSVTLRTLVSAVDAVPPAAPYLMTASIPSL
jgi:hypothetical protein